MTLTVCGNACRKCSTENGRNKRTLTTPTFSPCAVKYLTVEATVSAPEPMMMITRSASGAPS